MPNRAAARRSVFLASLAFASAAAACNSKHATMDGGPRPDAAPGVGGAAGTTNSAGGTGGATGSAGRVGPVGGASGGAGATGAAGSPSGGAGGASGAGASGGSGGVAGSGGSAASTCDPACGAHQTCVLQGSQSACACVTGYRMSGNGCVWGTVPADPGFQNMPAGAWTLAQGATIDPTAAGTIDPGALDILPSALCTGGGRAHQSISMPTLAQSEPFALALAANAECVARLGPGCRAMTPVVVINGGVIKFQDGPVNHVACLGERAYGGTFDLAIRPPDRSSCPQMDAVVDHVDIEPSSTCPPPGTIPDGDFDATPTTWKTRASGSDSGTPVAEIAPTLGSGGSAAAHLLIRGGCEQAVAHELFSPPLSIPNLALQVRFIGSVGATARVMIDGVTMAVFAGTGVVATGNVCLLEANKGMTQDMSLGVGVLGSLYDSLDCAAVNRDFQFDDLKFVSDASCPAAATLADGGFERTDPAAVWDSTLLNDAVASGPVTGGSIGIDATTANAHGGSRSLKIANSDGCGVRRATFAAAVAPSAGGAGPALQFFYKAPALTKSKLAVTVAGVSSGDLPAAPNYTRGEICLDPTMAGQTVTVEMSLAGNVEGVCSSYPAETAWFDDFAVTTSTACPAQ